MGQYVCPKPLSAESRSDTGAAFGVGVSRACDHVRLRRHTIDSMTACSNRTVGGLPRVVGQQRVSLLYRSLHTFDEVRHETQRF
jgi:hypothetical protein